MGKGKVSIVTVLSRIGKNAANNTVNNTLKTTGLYNTKVRVPMDFGIENLQCPVHNNIKLMVSNDEEVKANSLILSFNSPVFHDRFFRQHCTFVDLTNFTKKDATYFIEALYLGRIMLDQTDFRKINELAHKFEVVWLIARCDSFFQSKVCVHPFNDNYEELEFALGEAWYAKKTRKSEKHMRIFLENTVNMGTYKKRVFINKYTTNYLYLTVEQLNMMIKLAGNDGGILLNVVQENLVKQRYDLDDNSIHILKHINLENCIESDTDNFNEMFVNTLNKISNSKEVDEIRRLGLNATEKVLERKPHLQSKVKAIYTVSCPSTESDTYASIVGSSTLAGSEGWHASSYQQIDDYTPRSLIGNENLLDINYDPTSIPNLFHSLTSLKLETGVHPQYSGIKKDKLLVDNILDVAASSKEFKNLYMALEIICEYELCFDTIAGRKHEVTQADLDEVIKKLIDVKTIRGWSRVSPKFFGLWGRGYEINEELADYFLTDDYDDYDDYIKRFPGSALVSRIKKCKALVSDEDSVAIVCNRGKLQVTLSSRRHLYPHTIRMGEFLMDKNESDAKRIYKFYWKHPKIVSCSNPKQCGFIINVTPIKKRGPSSFDVGLCTEAEDYPDDIHFHPEVMSAQKMHFVLRRDFSITGTAKGNPSQLVYVSWAGKPIDDRNHIRWNDFIPYHGYIAPLMYYDIAEVNSK